MIPGFSVDRLRQTVNLIQASSLKNCGQTVCPMVWYANHTIHLMLGRQSAAPISNWQQIHITDLLVLSQVSIRESGIILVVVPCGSH